MFAGEHGRDGGLVEEPPDDAGVVFDDGALFRGRVAWRCS
jgi:hypothetical protein